MSTALAIAGVTAVLRDLLNDGLINHNISGVIGSTVTVSVLPPDRVVPLGGTERSQLNLFLYQVTPNAALRNDGLPSLDAAGRQRLTNPPLALDLHYLLSAYAGGDLHAEILLGYAMQLLHMTPVLTRAAIHAALTPSPDVGLSLPPALRALADAGLEHQIELVKITPEYLNTEDMSKLWTATHSSFRPTAAYVASVVLIQATEPTRAPLPVLTRGAVDPVSQRDRGVVVQPNLVPPLPTLERVAVASGQPAARLGETIDLHGHHLDGTNHAVLLTNERFAVAASLAPLAPAGATRVQFAIPVGQAALFPVGIYGVGARVQRPGETAARATNLLALTVAPDLLGLPMSVTRQGDGSAVFNLAFRPALRAGQRATLILGQHEFEPEPFTAPVTDLDFVIADAPPGVHLARLRVDGVDSPIIDRTASPPVFLDQRIEIL